MFKSTKHPYYPRTLELSAYATPTWTAAQILGVFFGALVVLVVGGAVALGRWRPNAGLGTRLVFFWMLASGVIHTVVEGYFVVFHKTFTGGNFYLDELWKEYALSDSRYAAGDAAVVWIEGVTAAVWGPLALVAAALALAGHPGRHLVQVIVSLGQLYGDVLYYATALAARGAAAHCHPHPYYFWFYFVFMNALWIVFPAAIIASSGAEILRALGGPAPASPKKTAAAGRRASPSKKE